MTAALLGAALVGLLPVLAFLATLLYLDSYKLVPARALLLTMLVGGGCAGLAWFINQQLLEATSLPALVLSRYVAPLVEELIKALVVVALLRAHRIGF